MPITVVFLVRVAIFLILLGLASHVSMRLLKNRLLTHTPLSHSQQYALARVLSYLVFALGSVIGLESIGLNLNSLVVIGGALGIGIGLGLQPIVTNFVAGLILLLEQPVRLGDRIEVGETYGDVVRMQGRSTWVRTNDNVVIIVPNSEFVNNRVTNWTANDECVRISLSVGVSYDANPQQVREILLDIARHNPNVLREKAPDVVFTEFGDSSLNFELRVWTEKHVQTPKVLKSDLYFSIFEAFSANGIEIPFPQRDLHVRSMTAAIPSLVGDGRVQKMKPAGGAD
ncbi:MAG TPA: mechanosensitive ion channel domain-containing protein [Terriglobales bacterium]